MSLLLPSPMESSCTSEEPGVRKEAESPPDLWLPHHCGCLLLFPAFFMYGRPAKTFPIDKSLSVFYTVITPYAESMINLHSEKVTGDKCHE